jgi:hypothetical protein
MLQYEVLCPTVDDVHRHERIHARSSADRPRAPARSIPHTRATRRARTRVHSRASSCENVSIRSSRRTRERARGVGARERNLRRGTPRARAPEVEDSHRTARVRRTRGRERAGERRERCRVIARERVGRDELVAERVGAEGGEQVSTGAKDRKWEFRRHLPRCARGSRARGRGRARECGARCA